MELMRSLQASNARHKPFAAEPAAKGWTALLARLAGMSVQAAFLVRVDILSTTAAQQGKILPKLWHAKLESPPKHRPSQIMLSFRRGEKFPKQRHLGETLDAPASRT